MSIQVRAIEESPAWACCGVLWNWLVKLDPYSMSCRFINRAEGEQGRFLRLVQPLGSTDVEPFVRSVAAQHLQEGAAVQIPDPDRPVITAAGYFSAIRAARQPLLARRGAGSLPHLLTA